MHVWTRLVRPENLDLLLAELADLDSTRLIVTRQPGKRMQRVQFFAENAAHLRTLQQNHGGRISAVQEQDWLAPMQKHPPILIRDRFALVENFSDSPTRRREIIIPAGLAFGTGDHPTTATCLRFLCDLAGKLPPKQWSLLDAGCGTGVLAMAGKLLGANKVLAFDYDPRAIRTARANARLNHIRGITWQKQDLLQLAIDRRYDVIAANIYSELFLAAWPQLRECVTERGFFILSGILNFQANECRQAILASGLSMLKETAKGKWVTFLAEAHSL